MKRLSRSVTRISVFVLLLSLTAITIAAQRLVDREQEFVDGASNRWWYTMIFIIVAALAVSIYFWRKSKKGDEQPAYTSDNRYKDYYSNHSYDMDSDGVDADKELEWLRQAKRSSKREKAAAKQKRVATSGGSLATPVVSEPDLDTKVFQEKMRKLQYGQLPINSFTQLTPSKMYTPLPLSNDPSLINAIDQADEEFEEDETVRALAVKILTAFRTRNSVDALSQIALYDLSSGLRSKAVATLTEFDHESAFEPLLLACADPTREVRAAAARGLFRLNFDRADAWKRIIETNDTFRMSHSARAAIESGIVVKSFERLVHEDLKVAYEAFALVTLLIRSGETKELFDAIRDHRDERVRFALLYVLKVTRDERTLPDLSNLQHDPRLPKDVADRVHDTFQALDAVQA